MFFAAGLILLGLALLVAGGEALLRGAVGLATLLRMTPAVIGLTVVAAGTSVPELAVSGIAGRSPHVVRVPQLADDVHDLDAIRAIGDALFATRAPAGRVR